MNIKVRTIVNTALKTRCKRAGRASCERLQRLSARYRNGAQRNSGPLDERIDWVNNCEFGEDGYITSPQHKAARDELIRARIYRGMSYRSVAKGTGVSIGHISKVMNNPPHHYVNG